MPRVTFAPSGRTIEAGDGELLLKVAARAGLPLRSPCGGKGSCGKCAVVVCPAPEPTPHEREALGDEGLALGLRCACQARITEDTEVDVPTEALLYDERILVDTASGGRPAVPAVRVVEFELAEPSLDDPVDDLRRLAAGVAGGAALEAPVEVLRRLPAALRENSFRGSAVVAGRSLLAVLPPGSADLVLGAAFDLGTTTLAGALVSMVSGDVLATSSRANPQGAFGDDVITRSDHARKGQAELDELRAKVTSAFDDMLGEMLAALPGAPERGDVYRVSVAGNTVMTHLFLGVSPEHIAVVPFTPAATGGVRLPASEAGIRASGTASVMTLPCVAGYVGGDIVGGMLAAGVHELLGVTLYIDIGTNGEVVLARDGSLYACSVAAGPAFEGARISQGMRAAAGAIDSVKLEGGDVLLSTVGGASACGICGTGLIDTAALLLESGLLDLYGLLAEPGAEPDGLPDALRGRMVDHDGKAAFRLSGEGDEAIHLTQKDVRELQLAKGAVAAGVMTLLGDLDLGPADVDSVLLAGGFGTFVDRENVLRVGLLPSGIDPSCIHFVGNAAAAGARMTLVSESHERRAEEIARAVRYVELSGRTDFQMTFADAMLFPEA